MSSKILYIPPPCVLGPPLLRTKGAEIYIKSFAIFLKIVYNRIDKQNYALYSAKG